MKPEVLILADRLEHNLKVLSDQAGTRKLFPVLKADAYGHGAVAVARLLEEISAPALVPYFCVARVGEARELREAGIQKPILVLSQFSEEDFRTPFPLNTDLSLHTFADFENVLRYSAQLRKAQCGLHINFNTGMNRLGVRWSLPLWESFLKKKIESLVQSGVRVTGLSSHFARGEESAELLSLQQAKKFKSLLKDLRAVWPSNQSFPEWIHIENSGALAQNLGHDWATAARPGIHLYGIQVRTGSDLKPALKLQAPIRQVFLVPVGEGLGYGHRYRAEQESLIGTVCLGYADGVDRRLSRSPKDKWSLGFVVQNELVPVAGTVSMDLCMVDLSQHSQAPEWKKILSQGQEPHLGMAEFIGDKQGAQEIASTLGTIPYEVLCSLGHRLPRRVVKS